MNRVFSTKTLFQKDGTHGRAPCIGKCVLTKRLN